MPGLRAGLVAAFCLSMCVHSVSAQPRAGIGDRGASDRDRDRGLLGRVGARRDERLNRNAPTPPAPNPGALNPNALNSAAARGANPAAVANRFNNPANNSNPYARAGVSGNTVNGRAGLAPNVPGATLPGTNNPANSIYGARGAAPALTPGMQAGQRNAYYPPNTPNPNLMPPNNNDVRPASGTAPINKLPYSGPGVLIRLPRTIAGEVNYLVDDSEHLVVHSGEDQLLRLKGSYEVRFSRGVTDDGKSYGEARYTITEGIYRFDVSANGWELYREGEARDVESAISEAQKREEQARRQDELAARDAALDSTTSLQPLPTPPLPLPPSLAPRDAQTREVRERSKESAAPATPLPSPAQPAEEETLPAPKSILEPT